MKKKILCCMMVALLVVGAAMPKKAYAFAGVDDAAVAIVLALAAAAGITFATNDGVQDAVQDFLTASNGKYDSTLERLYDAGVTAGGLTCFKIPVSLWSGVKALLEGLFAYFSVDENRQGVITVSGGEFFSSSLLAYDVDYSYNSPVVSPFYLYFDSYIDFSEYSMVLFFYKKDGLYRVYFSSNSSSQVRVEHWRSVAVSSDSVFSFGLNEKGKFTFFVDGVSVYSPTSYNPFSSFDYRDGVGTPLPRLGLFKGLSLHSDRYNVLVSSSYFERCFSEIYTLLGQVDLTGAYGFDSTDKSIPYGLTYPEDMTASDVIDNFEQKVKEGAGDTAIAVPADGVIDSTLPWTDAYEKYLVNVNEVGEIGDTTTETNTWLQKILKAIKALPATIADAVVGSGSLDFSGFKNIGLASVFPFCIPFDLKNALVGFNVAAADPIWEISFDGTFMSAAGSYVLDMKQFEKLFAIVRFFIYGGFVVSLILITRKIIKG